MRRTTRQRCGATLTIGGVKLTIRPPQGVNLVPEALPSYAEPLIDVAVLRWILQKELLRQDIAIIGDPGPLRRWVAIHAARLMAREVQLLALSRDTTEADLKQRKELVNGTLQYVDQPAVTAALRGHCLILEGLERAERNVLPVINNLLENREMNLDDGSCVIHPARYDSLLAQGKYASPSEAHEAMNRMGLRRASERFRVVGLTVATSKYGGAPLDPPLRSRFQFINVDVSMGGTSFHIPAGVGKDDADAMVAFATHHNAAQAVVGGEFSALPALSPVAVAQWGAVASAAAAATPAPSGFAALARRTPAAAHLGAALDMVMPFDLFVAGMQNRKAAQSMMVELDGLRKKNRIDGSWQPSVAWTLTRQSDRSALWTCGKLSVVVGCGTEELAESTLYPDMLPSQVEVMHSMIFAHAAGRHIALVGEAASGKSFIAERFSKALGWSTIHVMSLHPETSTRELLQRRVVANGVTAWEPSPLVECAIAGGVIVLDGIDALPQGSLAVLQQLLVDGCTTLPDGTQLVGAARYAELVDALGLSEVRRRGIHAVHPSFRVIATARPPEVNTTRRKVPPWMSLDVASMFLWHRVRLTDKDERAIVASAAAGTATQGLCEALIALRKDLNEAAKTDNDTPKLSMRQLRRIVQLAEEAHRVHRDPSAVLRAASVSVEHALLVTLRPAMTQSRLRGLLKKHGLLGKSKVRWSGGHINSIECSDGSISVRLGDAEICRHSGPRTPAEAALIPHVPTFFRSEGHDAVIEWLAETHACDIPMLIMGSQGVGKNKAVDQFLSVARIPRQYMQLHRDTTLASLSTVPNVVGGTVTWSDSAMVKAIREGHTLVLDEVDKAPIDVVVGLKALLDGNPFRLGDGRVILSRGSIASDERDVVMHGSFRLIALANPPSFPFHGNDFYKSCGDQYACYVMGNPDANALVALLRPFAPTVPTGTLRVVMDLFGELRKLHDDGRLVYPYSLREMIAVAKHLEAFPADGVGAALHNVLAADASDPPTVALLRETLARVHRGTDAVRDGLAKEIALAATDGTHKVPAGGHALRIEVQRVKDAEMLDTTTLDVDVQKLALRRPSSDAITEIAAEASLPLDSTDFIMSLTAAEGSVAALTKEKKVFRIDDVAQPPLGYLEGLIHSRISSASVDLDPAAVTLLPPLKQEILIADRARCELIVIDMTRGMQSRVPMIESRENDSIVDVHGAAFGIVTVRCSPTLWRVWVGLSAYDVKLSVPAQKLIGVSAFTLRAEILNEKGEGVSYVFSLKSDDPEGTPTPMREGEVLISDGKSNTIAVSTTGETVYARYGGDTRGVSTVTVYTAKDSMGSATSVAVDAETQQTLRWQRGHTAVDIAALDRNTTRRVEIPAPAAAVTAGVDRHIAAVATTDGRLVMVDTDGPSLRRRVAQGISQSDALSTPTSSEWSVDYSGPRYDASSNLRHGDEDDQQHVGGNRWAGGTGGTDTAGLGGLVGPYRLDKGHKIHQAPIEKKKAVPKHIQDEARRLGKEALARRLQEIGMSTGDLERYYTALHRVESDVSRLKAMSLQLSRGSEERTWVRHQSEGVFDDAKLVEGVIGESNIFKRRCDGGVNHLKNNQRRRLLFCLDVSASMYRFNSLDGRLSRLVESVVMVMEGLSDAEGIEYSMVGHNGNGAQLPLVEFGAPPKTARDRLTVVERIVAYAQYCWSGDATLDTITEGLQSIVRVPCDDYLLIVVSDANFTQYGYNPKDIAKAMTADSRVQVYMLLIASLGHQAEDLQRWLPPGRALQCMQTSDLPIVLQRIFDACGLLSR